MDIYYQKIRRRSVKSIVFSAVMMLVGGYFIYRYCIAYRMLPDDSLLYTVFGAALLGVGLLVLISSMRGASKLKKKIVEMGLDEYLLAQDLESGSSYKDCNIGQKYALQCKGSPEVIRLDDALVVYMDVESTTSKGYTSYSYYIKVVERSGEEKYLTADDEDEMKEIFTQIKQLRPYVITKMDSVMRELKKKNIQELIKIVDERRTQYESGSYESGNA